MDIKIIQSEFGKDCQCENDVVRKCILKTKEIQTALNVLGVDISRSNRLNYIYSYLVFRLQDTKKEKQQLERDKIILGLKTEED